MKKIATYLIIGTLLVNLSSCSKEEIKIADNETTVESNYKDSRAPDGRKTLYSYMEFYYDASCSCMVGTYTFIFCAWPSRNCLAEVGINSRTPTSINNEVDQFLINYNNSSLVNYFSDTSYKLLFPSIDSLDGIIDSITSGKVIIHKFYNSHDSTDYYIGLPYGTEMTTNWDEWIPKASCVLRLRDDR